MKSYSLRQTAPVLLLLPALLAAIALTGLGSWQTTRVSNDLADQVLQQAGDRVQESVTAYLNNAVLLTEHAALNVGTESLPTEQIREWRPEMLEYLRAFPDVNSFTFGKPDGEATWLIRYPGEEGLEYAILDDQSDGKLLEYAVSDEGELGKEISDYEYDPRVRPWYRAAIEAGEPTWSPPYPWIRGNGGESTLGIAFARPLFAEDGTLIGIVDSDISLRNLSEFLKKSRVYESGESFLFDSEGGLLGVSGDTPVIDSDGNRIFTQDSNNALIAALGEAIEHTKDNPDHSEQAITVGDTEYRVELQRVDGPWELNWRLAVVVPNDEILSGASALRRQSFWIGGVIVLATLGLGIWIARKLVNPVTELVGAVRRIGGGDLDHPVEIHGPLEFEQLSRELNQMAAALKDRMRLRQSLSLAMEIQQKLLPNEPPKIPGMQVTGRSTYCDETGGDYYDFLELGETDTDGLIVVLGDVMGHGIAAALLMATARGILRSRAGEEDSLGEWLTHINRLLVEDTGGERFMTMVLLVIDPKKRRVRTACAGHDLPLVYDPTTDSFTELEDFGGLPLGLISEEDYTEVKLDDFAEGTLLLVATDGLWESENEQGQPYGKDRICESMRAHAEKPAELIAEEITKGLEDFRGSAQQDDDITFVLVKLSEEPEAAVGNP